jgi:hypothetical protein
VKSSKSKQKPKNVGNPNKRVGYPNKKIANPNKNNFCITYFFIKILSRNESMYFICCDLSLLIFFGEVLRVSKLSYDCVGGRIDEWKSHFRPKTDGRFNDFIRFHIRE